VWNTNPRPGFPVYADTPIRESVKQHTFRTRLAGNRTRCATTKSRKLISRRRSETENLCGGLWSSYLARRIINLGCGSPAIRAINAWRSDTIASREPSPTLTRCAEPSPRKAAATPATSTSTRKAIASCRGSASRRRAAALAAASVCALAVSGCAYPGGYGGSYGYQQGGAKPAAWAIGGAALGGLAGGGAGLLAQNQQSYRSYAPQSSFVPQGYNYGYSGYRPPIPAPYAGGAYGYGHAYAPPPGVRW
jgi:hypothetical protein